MNAKRGDILLLDHPFSDASGSKVRPVLVVQTDVRNLLLTNMIVVMIKKNLNQVGTDSTQLLLDIATSDGKQTGLMRNSAVTCGNLFTVHQALFRRKIGKLSAQLMQQVDDCLRVALDLS